MRDIKGYEGIYAITSCGRVWSYRSKKFLKPNTDKDGYEYVILQLNKNKKTIKIHRLVAETYIPNPDNLPQINHKDEVRNHNWINNLEWCDAKYNTRYSKAKKVKCIETGEIFESRTDAAKKVNRSPGSISDAIKTGYKCAGFHWSDI